MRLTTSRHFEQRRQGASLRPMPLSLYVQYLWFWVVESVVLLTAPATRSSLHHERGAEYLRYLSREVDLHTSHVGLGQVVSQLHLGGGSPTSSATTNWWSSYMLRRSFTPAPAVNIRSRSTPGLWTSSACTRWPNSGSTGSSFGVQDFDLAVQKAVHRTQPAEQVFAAREAACRIWLRSRSTSI